MSETLTATARNNLRYYIRHATFKVEVDRTAALNCVEVLEQEATELRETVARLREALEGVLPYTEAERLAEESAIRLGAQRAPIRLAVQNARKALENPDG